MGLLFSAFWLPLGIEMRFLNTWLERPVAALSWSIALLAAGIWAVFATPLEWTPEVELPEVRITADWPGASPQAVERYVAAPIERAVQQVAGASSVESFSEEGKATIILGVSRGVDLAPYVARIDDQLAFLRERLPPYVTPRLAKEIPEALRDQRGFLTIQLVGPLTPDALYVFAEDRIVPKLRSLEGVGDIVMSGGAGRELLVELDPALLAAYGVGPEDARRRLREVTTDQAYGRLRDGRRGWLLMSPGEAQTDALRKIVLKRPEAGARPVRLSDVARVRPGFAPASSISRIDGQPVVTLTLDRIPGSNLLKVARNVEERLAGLRADLPEGARLLVADDRSEDAREQLRDLAWRGGVALLLIALVLLLMLRSVRATGVVFFAAAIPLAVAFLLLRPLGLTLNLLTLAGLVLVFGLLVDNAVIVVEQFAFSPEQATGGRRLHERAKRALDAVWFPLLGGTLSTVAVLLPLAYLSGELRPLFLPFGALTGLTLLASLAAAAWLIPVLARWLPARPRRRRVRRILKTASSPYRLAARFPVLSCLFLLLLLGVPLWLIPPAIKPPEAERSRTGARLANLYNATIGSDAARKGLATLEPMVGGMLRLFKERVQFGARWDYGPRSVLYVTLEFPPGNSIERSDAAMRRLEEKALPFASVEQTIARIAEDRAFLLVTFSDASLATSEPYLARQEIIRETRFLGGVDISVAGLVSPGYHYGGGERPMHAGVPLTVEAYGPDYDDLEALSEQFAERVRSASPRIVDVNIHAGRYSDASPRETLHFRWDSDAEARTGVPARELAGYLRPVFSTRSPSFHARFGGEAHVPVRIVVRDADRIDAGRLVRNPLPVRDSTYIQLAGLADFSMENSPPGVERYNQQYKRYIRMYYMGSPADAPQLVKDELEKMSLPAGYRFENASFFAFERLKTEFGWLLPGSLLLVFLILAAAFESWGLSLLAMSAVPAAIIGVAAGFLATGVPFAEGAFIGSVLLAGIVANDTILLLDRYRKLRGLRPETPSSVLARLAVRDRLWPMWTTTLTSIAGMAPLLLFPDGNDLWIGLAVTVAGGLLASTLLGPAAAVAMLSLRSRPARAGWARVAGNRYFERSDKRRTHRGGATA